MTYYLVRVKHRAYFCSATAKIAIMIVLGYVKNDVSNIKSVLNKYLNFINSGRNIESITDDLLKISNNEKNNNEKLIP